MKRKIRQILDMPGLTFSRGSTAISRTTNNAFQSFGINQLRINDRGLLIESQRTNLVTHSNQYSAPSPAWGKNGTPTIVMGVETAPDGTLNGNTIENINNNGNCGIYHYSSLTGGLTYTASAIIKNINGTGALRFGSEHAFGRINFNMSNRDVAVVGSNVNSYSFEDLANGWYKVNVTFTPTVDISSTTTLFTTLLGQKIAAWYIGLEQGASSTSVMPTSGTAETRNADILKFNLAKAPNENFKITGEVEFTKASGSNQYVFDYGDGTSTNRVAVLRLIDGTFRAVAIVGGSQTVIGGTSKTGARVVNWELTRTGNSYVFTVDGTSLPATIVNGLPEIDTLAVGQTQVGGSALNDYIRRFKIV